VDPSGEVRKGEVAGERLVGLPEAFGRRHLAESGQAAEEFSAAIGDSVAQGMSDSQPASMMKFVLGALAAVAVLNFVFRLMVGLGGIPVSIGVSIGVAGFTAWWIARSLGRDPTPQERRRFLRWYGGILALLFVVLVLLASTAAKKTPSIGGLITLLLHYLPYPAFAQMFLSEKHFSRFRPK
jgi:peptidoglycan biosynthesis protein MviN/MurJ (putative lipid II flippase)